MKRIFLSTFGALLFLTAYSVLPRAPVASAQFFPLAPNTTVGSATSQTYNILVGGEDTSVGAEYLAFFTANVTVNVGDTVVWKQNSHEIHSVSFLGNLSQPPDLLAPVPNAPAGAVMFIPTAALPASPTNGQYDGTSYANSGIMGMDPGQAQNYTLTFAQPGTYTYYCLVHPGMKATVTVLSPTANPPAGAPILSPADVAAQGQKEMSDLAAQVPVAIKAANADVKPDVKNADGTTTHYLIMGYNQGALDLTAFYPQNLTVTPGDTVIYQLGPHNVAPHTATFLNGQMEPDLVVPQPQPNGPPLLTLNAAVGLPQNANQPLSAQGIYNTGMLDPSAPGSKEFQFKVASDATGQLAFLCLLHDSSGMKGTLTVTK
jgi:plastocyanin